MQKMVMFRLNRECRDIAVNPSRILYISHYETGASSVHFSKDCFVRVQGDMEEIVAKIEAALDDRTPELRAPVMPREIAHTEVN